MRGTVKKKLDKIYRKDLEKTTDKEAKALAAMFFTHVIKPKPFLLPMCLWSRLFRLFVHVPKGYKPNFSRERGLENG